MMISMIIMPHTNSNKIMVTDKETKNIKRISFSYLIR
jgi:hypothetical protein